jgi:hypothetical protein
MRQGKRIEGALFPISGIFGPFCAVSVPLTPERQHQPSAAIMKIVMIQWLFKFSLS